MRAMSLSELAVPLQATLIGADVEFTNVSTDSRALRAGDLFVALQGENFDGHQYLAQVARADEIRQQLTLAVRIDKVGNLLN